MIMNLKKLKIFGEHLVFTFIGFIILLAILVVGYIYHLAGVVGTS